MACQRKKELQKKSEPWKGPKNFLIKLVLIAGWLILLLLVYKVSQFDYEMANFDPYEILGIPTEASQSEIKKAYRRLSLILHPDKDTGNEKEFMKLSKAYQVNYCSLSQIIFYYYFILFAINKNHKNAINAPILFGSEWR